MINLTPPERLNLVETHKAALRKYGVTTNLYWRTLEGRPSYKYLKHWSAFTACISSTTYVSLMTPLVAAMRKFFDVVGKAKAVMAESDILKADNLSIQIKNLYDELQRRWPNVNLTKKGDRFKEYSLGNKFHLVFAHTVEFMRIWGCSAGWVNEESVEALNKDLGNLFKRYSTQRGCLRVKYAMSQLHLMTSPKYRKS